MRVATSVARKGTGGLVFADVSAVFIFERGPLGVVKVQVRLLDMDVKSSMCGREMWLAPGVRLGEVNWYLTCIIRCYQDVCEQYRVVGCITGGIDEPYGVVELDHKDSRALDLRSRDFKKPELVALELMTRLSFYGSRFIVKYLDVGYGKHFHVAWR